MIYSVLNKFVHTCVRIYIIQPVMRIYDIPDDTFESDEDDDDDDEDDDDDNEDSSDEDGV